ncbi:MAG: SLC13 family permease [Desulfobulbaceae bacterium]|nr:SLC13 family permease [Desulfobulbaceae bacterium]
MEIPMLTSEMITVFAILGLVVILLVFDLLRVDVVGLLVMTSLPLTGLLKPGEATAGLGSTAVVVLICVMVIGTSLNKTGTMSIVAQKILNVAGNSQSRVLSLVALAAALPSAIMSNVGAAALMLPATIQVAKKSKIPVSKLVMPMGFCANMGGNLTLIGSTPFIILNDVMGQWWKTNPPASGETFTPLGLFAVTPIGIALLIATIAYFLLIGCRLLPAGEGSDDGRLASGKLRSIYGGEVGQGMEFVIPPEFAGRNLGQLDMRAKYRISIVAVAKDGGKTKILAPLSTTIIEPGDTVLAVGNEESIRKVIADLGWQPEIDIKTFVSETSQEKSGVLEGIVTAHSSLNDHTMGELQLKKLFTVNPLALMRGKKIHIEKLESIVLKPGDAVLLSGGWDNLRYLQEKTAIVYTEKLRGVEVKEEKAWVALAALGIFLILSIFMNISLAVAGLVALLILVIGKVLHIDEVYRAIEWKTVFLVAGLIPLGAAFEKTGAANFLAMSILQQISGIGPLALYLILALLTSFFALFVSNVGTTVLLVPLAMNLASQIGADPKIAGLVVAISSINTFMLPTHQVNALIMQPGGYKTSDYMRVGSGMMVLFLLILMAMLAVFY